MFTNKNNFHGKEYLLSPNDDNNLCDTINRNKTSRHRRLVGKTKKNSKRRNRKSFNKFQRHTRLNINNLFSYHLTVNEVKVLDKALTFSTSHQKVDNKKNRRRSYTIRKKSTVTLFLYKQKQN